MTRLGRLWIIGGMAALATFPAIAGADALPPDIGNRTALARFNALDHQGNRLLTLDDLSSAGAAARLFTILDRDGDGTLTVADGAPARQLLRRAGTRTLTRQRFAGLGASRWLAALDNDADGRLSLAELRPSLAGNAPLDTPAASPTRPDVVAAPARPPSCWFFDGTRWVELPGSTPTCRQR
ncbi:MAG: hypothetical protein ACM31D_13575 [Bacteroidota bacterium]